MKNNLSELTRRSLLKGLGISGSALAFSQLGLSQDSQPPAPMERLASFTGPGANPYWNAMGVIAPFPQKAPLVVLTDRPVQLETPRSYFVSPITPNSAFFVRWHLDGIPNEVDLPSWRLHVEGNVERPLALSFTDLLRQFGAVSLAGTNQCSGNSRSRFQPRVPGGQWGNGAMGCAHWTGVRLKDVLGKAGVKSGSIQVQMQGLERGQGPVGKPSREFFKALDLDNPVLDEAVVAYAMNGEPLPMLNGFPVRLIVPGYFATYWVKCLTWLRILTKQDNNFWMNPAYRIPDTPRGDTTPADVKAGKVKMIPINLMPVRSFLISPDGDTKIPAGLPVTVRGIAFSGSGRVVKVEVSQDGASTWAEAKLSEDLGPYAFRAWEYAWKPERPGRFELAVRATDEKGNVQPNDGVWNPGGYLWNKTERQEIVVGSAS